MISVSKKTQITQNHIASNLDISRHYFRLDRSDV